jgi:PAS domain S-box-containing protein
LQLSPLITTVREIDDIAHNRKPFAFLPVKSQDEVGQLIDSFNKLLKKLDEREMQLFESEIFSHAILNSVPVEIAVLDQHGTIIMVNKPWLLFSEKYSNEREVNEEVKSVGVNYLEVCRASMVDDTHGDAAEVLKGIKDILEGRLPSFSLEYKCESPTQVYWFSLIVTPLNHHNSGAVVSHTDITQRKQTEQALYVAWASAQAALDAIFWLDKEAKIVDVNLAASKLLGYGEKELVTLHLADVSPDEPFDMEKWDQYFIRLKQESAVKMETKLRGRCGRTVEVEVNAAYIKHENKELVCAFVRDITDKKRDEIALRNAKIDAERANSAKSKFLAATSHDLRQPLSALALYVDLLSRYKQPRIKGVVTSIQGCVESMSELLTDLLDISKLEAGVVQPNNTYFFVDELLQKLVTIFSAESNIKKLSLRYRPSNLIANSDQKLFFRIIGNLISNAIRYTESGGILVACRPHQGRYYIEVFDTGIGIDDDQIELIFEEFKQLGDESRHRGSGLGLAIVKKMTVLMGLDVIVSSRPGRGSIFRVEIPIVDDAALYQDFSIEASLAGAVIAVIDDNVEIINALKLTLESVGYQVIVGTSGETILANLDEKKPDLILSDFRLQKGENGFDVIDVIRQHLGQAIPAILMTGDTDPNMIRTMQDSGISVLFKPLQFTKLKELITTTLQNGKL